MPTESCLSPRKSSREALCTVHRSFNPHHCGYFGDLKRECRRSSVQVQRYRLRIFGPLLDRIDIHVEALAVQFKELTSTHPAEPSSAIREWVPVARAIQQQRFVATPKIRCNAWMSSKLLKPHCHIDEESQELLRSVVHELNLSARAHDCILKIARTIADLEGSPAINTHHLSEAPDTRQESLDVKDHEFEPNLLETTVTYFLLAFETGRTYELLITTAPQKMNLSKQQIRTRYEINRYF